MNRKLRSTLVICVSIVITGLVGWQSASASGSAESEYQTSIVVQSNGELQTENHTPVGIWSMLKWPVAALSAMAVAGVLFVQYGAYCELRRRPAGSTSRQVSQPSRVRQPGIQGRNWSNPPFRDITADFPVTYGTNSIGTTGGD